MTTNTETAMLSMIGPNIHVSLLVRGEPPEEAAEDVADPEEGVDQHRLVVLLTHPVLLRTGQKWWQEG